MILAMTLPEIEYSHSFTCINKKDNVFVIVKSTFKSSPIPWNYKKFNKI